MTQQDVYNYLKKNENKWFSVKELNKKLKFGCSADNLRRLFKSGFVMRKETKVRGIYAYSYSFRR